MSDLVDWLNKFTDGYSREEQEDGSPLAVMIDAKSLIEQQAAKIAELEAANDHAFKSEIAGYEHSKALVEELREANRNLHRRAQIGEAIAQDDYKRRIRALSKRGPA